MSNSLQNLNNGAATRTIPVLSVFGLAARQHVVSQLPLETENLPRKSWFLLLCSWPCWKITLLFCLALQLGERTSDTESHEASSTALRNNFLINYYKAGQNTIHRAEICLCMHTILMSLESSGVNVCCLGNNLVH